RSRASGRGSPTPPQGCSNPCAGLSWLYPKCPEGLIETLVLGTIVEYPGQLEHIVPLVNLIGVPNAASRGVLLLHPGGGSRGLCQGRTGPRDPQIAPLPPRRLARGHARRAPREPLDAALRRH